MKILCRERKRRGRGGRDFLVQYKEKILKSENKHKAAFFPRQLNRKKFGFVYCDIHMKSSIQSMQ